MGSTSLAHGCARPASVPLLADAGFSHFLTGIRDVLIIGGTMVMVLVLGGCKAVPEPTPGIDSADGQARTVDARLDAIIRDAKSLGGGQ
jgi:hypothetical protein